MYRPPETRVHGVPVGNRLYTITYTQYGAPGCTRLAKYTLELMVPAWQIQVYLIVPGSDKACTHGVYLFVPAWKSKIARVRGVPECARLGKYTVYLAVPAWQNTHPCPRIHVCVYTGTLRSTHVQYGIITNVEREILV